MKKVITEPHNAATGLGLVEAEKERDALLAVARAAQALVDDANCVVGGQASHGADCELYEMEPGIFGNLEEFLKSLPDSIKAEIEQR